VHTLIPHAELDKGEQVRRQPRVTAHLAEQFLQQGVLLQLLEQALVLAALEQPRHARGISDTRSKSVTARRAPRRRGQGRFGLRPRILLGKLRVLLLDEVRGRLRGRACVAPMELALISESNAVLQAEVAGAGAKPVHHFSLELPAFPGNPEAPFTAGKTVED